MGRGRTFLLNQLGTSNGAGGGVNEIPYFTAPFTLGSEAAFAYNPSTNTLLADNLTSVLATFSTGIGLGTGTASASTPISFIGSSDAARVADFFNNSTGTSAFMAIRVGNATVSNSMVRMTAFGTGFSTSGASLQDSGQIASGSDLSGGLTVGTLAAFPLQLFTNNILRLALAGDGTYFRPVTDDSLALGGAANRYSNVFATALTTQGANGQATNIQRATTTVSAATAATLTASNLIPAGSLVIGVDTRVLTTFDNSSGLTTFSIGDGTDADRFGLNIARTAGTTTTLANTTITSAPLYAAATNIVLTADAGTFNVAAGQIRITVHYISLTAATS